MCPAPPLWTVGVTGLPEGALTVRKKYSSFKVALRQGAHLFGNGVEIPKEKIRFAGTRSILTVWVGGGVGGGGWAGNYPGVGPTYNINLHLKRQ